MAESTRRRGLHPDHAARSGKAAVIDVVENRGAIRAQGMLPREENNGKADQTNS
jgi:hypothetical protein